MYLSVNQLTLNDFYQIVFQGKKIKIAENALQRVTDSYNFLHDFLGDKLIYGINTGLGPMAQYRIDDSARETFQYNIIRSHSTGTGNALPAPYAKALMLARLSTFLQGYSGVHPDLPLLLQEFINKEIYPQVFEHGGVGASGDLVQLAHLALNLIGEGEIFYEGKLQPAKEVFTQTGLTPLKMYIREGLSLINGTSVMTGIGLVNLLYAKNLFSWAMVTAVMINEVVGSLDDHFSEELNRAKLHEGQQKVASLMRQVAVGSKRIGKREDLFFHKIEETEIKEKVQEYYSIRCIPQILGIVYDTLMNTEKVLVNEINSSSDNPVIDREGKNIYHGGNFHGDYVSFEMDKLKIAMTKLTMLTERQLNYLMHDRVNGILPPFVNLGVLGVNYGMQAAQFTATSTTAECQTLSNPMYIHSIPNNNDNQDIVSMGTNGALITKTVVENAHQVMAIQLMALVQAIDYLKIQSQLSPFTQGIYNEIRLFFPAFVEDSPLYLAIKQMTEFIKNKQLNLI